MFFIVTFHTICHGQALSLCENSTLKFILNIIVLIIVLFCISVFVTYNLYNMINVSSIKTAIVDIGEVSRTVKREMIIVKNEYE